MARRLLALGLAAGGLLSLFTLIGQRPLPARLDLASEMAGRVAVLDRQGRLLQSGHDGGWNLHERLSLQAMPPLLPEAFVAAEDRRFWTHAGIDWRARLAAVAQNLRAGRSVRGASTISEQVVRLLHPRSRTLWSRWLEGWEALRLEARFSKAEILEFYLNQVPFGANRRGVLSAARLHFDRHVDTLAPAEILALAVLVRAPTRLARDPQALQDGVARLAQALVTRGSLSVEARAAVLAQPATPARHAVPPTRAAHFVREVERRSAQLDAPASGRVRSSLDPQLQPLAESYLADRLQDVSREGARQGAVLIVEWPHNRVRAWAVGDVDHPQIVGVDAVRAPRQPGSTLKPLLYALAVERGWDADTLIDDAPLAERVNGGLHQYRNYSRGHYGRVSLREALGNSLNIPAVRTLQFVGGADFLDRLRAIGMQSLSGHPNVYGDGLALGNGEVSLYELVQAYTALAADGRWQPLTVFEDEREARRITRAYPPQAARAIAAILSDPSARALEFGSGGVLRFPLATAVKTGTSSDYRDAWTLAYDGRYVVGVWIGNLSGRETQGVTGARGPALLTRSLLAALAERSLPLPVPTGSSNRAAAAEGAPITDDSGPPRLLQPFEGLKLARDPRIPDGLEAFEFQVAGAAAAREVRWWVDGAPAGRSATTTWAWPLVAGEHRVYAELVSAEGQILRSNEVRFHVQ